MWGFHLRASLSVAWIPGLVLFLGSVVDTKKTVAFEQQPEQDQQTGGNERLSASMPADRNLAPKPQTQTVSPNPKP